MKLEKRKTKSFFNNNIPANIRLVSSEDVLIKTNILTLIIRLQDVFKASSRRFQDVFTTSSRHLAKMSSRHFQGVYHQVVLFLITCFQDVFKTCSRLWSVLQSWLFAQKNMPWSHFWEIMISGQKQGCSLKKIWEISQESVPEYFFWCFLVKFAKLGTSTFLQNSTRRLLLNTAVSVVAKGVLDS